MSRIYMVKKSLSYLGKQPIFNESLKVIGHELLYRDSLNNSYPVGTEPHIATSLIVNTFSDNQTNLSTCKRSFINFDYKSIINRLPLLLDKNTVVIEILESCTPDKELLFEIIELHKKGYCIALDDYNFKTNWTEFFPYISIIKICLHQVNIFDDEIQKNIIQLNHHNLQLLAEKIESKEVFITCKDLGFSLYQGYFLAKPSVSNISNDIDFCYFLSVFSLNTQNKLAILTK